MHSLRSFQNHRSVLVSKTALKTCSASSVSNDLVTCVCLFFYSLLLTDLLNWKMLSLADITCELSLPVSIPPPFPQFLWLQQEPLFAARVIYDLLFFFMVIIIVLNLIFGVIIDTFADLRSEKQKKEEILKTTCFICGEERSKITF